MNAELIEKESIGVSKIIAATTNTFEDLNQKLASAQRLDNEFKAKSNYFF